MNKRNWIISTVILVLIILGLFLYQNKTDNTYQGMSIIPEKHEDIPLFEGLEPTEHQYVLNGNRWIEVYEFYLNELPKLGWSLEYEGSSLNDNDPENDWGGFLSQWRKEGFDGELHISAHYNQYEEQTEVIFDKTSIYNSTTWIEKVPKSICIYQNLNDETCSEKKDQIKIEQIVDFINDAIDWENEVLTRKNSSLIDFGDIKIKVFYEKDKEVYLQSEKGIKLMKPDPGFFKITNLSQ